MAQNKAVTRFPTPYRHRACLAGAALLFLAFVALPAFSQRNPKSQARRAAAPRGGAVGVTADPLADLQPRRDALKQAIATGDPEQVLAASQKLAAQAQVRVGNLKMLVGSYPQALELYRKSLALEDTPQTRISIALAALRAGQIDEATDQVSNLLNANPSNSLAWYVRGKCWFAKGNFESAIDSFKKSLALKDNPNVRYSLGLAFLGAEKKAEAEAVFRQMLRDYGDRAIWHVVFAGAYQQTGDLEDAIREFRRAIAMDPKVSHAHLYLGLALLEQNHWARTEESTAEIRAALRQDPNNFIANVVLGVGESQLKQFALSNEHLRKATTLQPKALEPWLYLGLNAFQENRYAAAKPYLLKAIELSTNNPSQGNYEIRRAYIALSRIEFSAGNKADADRYVARAKELQEKAHASTAERLAEAMDGMGGAAVVIPRQKMPEGSAMRDAFPTDPTAPLNQAALENVTLEPLQQEQIKTIEKRLRALLSQCYNDWGTAEARQQLYALALEHFQEAERWDNSTPGMEKNVALAALRLGDSKEAERALRITVEQDPNDQTSRARLAMLYYKADDYADAAKQFDALGDTTYRDPGLLYAWAYSLARIKESKRATDVLKHLVAFDLSPEVLLSVGDLYGVMQDYEHAVSTYRRALQLNPNLPKAHYKTGAALIRLSRPADAANELEAELRISPNDVDVQYNLAYALLRIPEKEKAMEILKTIVSTHPDHPGAQYELGKALLDDGNLQDGVQHLEIATKLDPERDYIHYQLQTAYRRLGRKEDADREASIYRELKARQREEATIPYPSKQQ